MRSGLSISRRELLRRSLGAGVAISLIELVGGTIGFLWPSGSVAAPRVRAGTLDDIAAANAGIPFRDGFPA